MHQPDASDNLQAFYKKVDGIDSPIAKLTSLLTKLQTANGESKAVTKASTIKAIKQRMEKDIDEVGKIARMGIIELDELEKDICFHLTLLVSVCYSFLAISAYGLLLPLVLLFYITHLIGRNLDAARTLR